MSAVLESVLTPEQRKAADAADAQQQRPCLLTTADTILVAAKTATTHNGYTSWPVYADELERRVRELCAELDVLNGKGQTAQVGCSMATLSMDEADVLVEYEYTPGEEAVLDINSRRCGPGCDPTLSILNVFVNGHWIDASYIAPGVLERWEVQLFEDMSSEAR